ncbi:eukaryotic translation initiation factor 5 [Lucilia sericata]|uniref:eukaryotic translation initiation factor 5 n=1 Tax=Lucilia sericata TaxID=13632 RepID=UPI0018A836AB|nr:eukaryotic translation initiation factor 5 [Lucilia sericata]XP_037816604.1 eukaryotic translation initiation factor 5 [Lucilia sericata]
MGSVNVNRNVTDIFYRYKMPRIQAKVEGKGNGIKTVIVNMAEVARAIGRPATYPTKYFGCELGAQTQFDYKNERFIVNGSHDAAKLQDLLDGFIRKFVLCPECDNPETDLTVSAKNQTISQSCKACGFHGLLKVNHKVNTFILKNPPTINPAAQGSSLTEGKRTKRKGKNGENGVSDANNSMGKNSDGDSDGGNQASQTEAEISAALPEKNDDDDDWSVDVSKEAIRARLQDLTDGAKSMTISDDYDKTEKERIDIFYEIVKKKLDAGKLESVAEHKDLLIEAERLDIVNKASLVLAELLFSENLPQDVRKHRVLLLRFTHNNPKAQRYLIGGIEQVIALHKDKLLTKVAGIFKLFYDADILDEKVILEWSQKVSKKYVPKDVATEIHEKAKPFIQWLKEAEEEDSSEEEDDEDSEVEIEYNDRARVEPLKAVNQVANNKKVIEEEDDGEEIDIDDI